MKVKIKVKTTTELKKIKEMIRRSCQLIFILLSILLFVRIYDTFFILPNELIILVDSAIYLVFYIAPVLSILIGLSLPSLRTKISKLSLLSSFAMATLGAFFLCTELGQKSLSVLGKHYYVRASENFGFVSISVAAVFFLLVIILAHNLENEAS